PARLQASLPPPPRWGQRRCRSGAKERLRQCCEESRHAGGQASDQASRRDARPAPARSLGQLNHKDTPERGQQDLESRASTTDASLTPNTDDTATLSQQDLTLYLATIFFHAVALRAHPVLHSVSQTVSMTKPPIFTRRSYGRRGDQSADSSPAATRRPAAPARNAYVTSLRPGVRPSREPSFEYAACTLL